MKLEQFMPQKLITKCFDKNQMRIYSDLYKFGEEKASEDFDLKNILRRIKANSKANFKLS